MSSADEALDPSSFQYPIRILSDIHFGHPGCRVQGVQGLRPLLEGAGTAIFNGDTFEYKKLKMRPVIDQLRVDLEALCDEIGVRYVYVTGNHDSQLSANHYFDLEGGKVFLTHGDLLYDDVSPWSQLIDSIHEERDLVRAEFPQHYLADLDLRLAAAKRIAFRSKVRKVGGRQGFIGRVRSVLWESWPPRRPVKILQTWARSHHIAHTLRDQFRPDAEFMIIGHTHRALVHRAGGKYVINTGAFLPISKAYLVELGNDELRVVECTPRSGSCEFGREVARFELRG